MKTRNIVALAALTFALPVGASAQGMATASKAAVRGVAPSMDIVETAVAAGSFKTLAAALQAAGLVDALKGKGPSRCSPRPMKPSPSCRPARWTRCSRTMRS